MIVSMGECLIDLVGGGVGTEGHPLFRAQPGGSPYNTAIAVATLGSESGFICPTSNDPFGAQLRQRLREEKAVSPSDFLPASSSSCSSMPIVDHHRRRSRSSSSSFLKEGLRQSKKV